MPEFVIATGILFLVLFVSIGTLGAVAIVAGGVTLAFIRPDIFVRTLKWWPLLVLPFFEVLTAVWSPEPMLVLRYATEFFLTSYIGILLILVLGRVRFILSLCIAAIAVLAASIVSGHRGYYSDTGTTLVGFAGSKNNMSFIAGLAAQCCLGLTVVRLSPAWKVGAIPLFIFSIILALGSHSASGAISAIVGIALFALLAISYRLSQPARAAVAALVVTVACVGGIIWVQFGGEISSMILSVLHKDAGLTGRAELWAAARQFIAERPWLGRGYREIWTGQSEETLGLLRWAGITDGRAFYFHQTYLETTVDSGIIGLCILVISFLGIGVGFAGSYLKGIAGPDQFFCIIYILLMLRSVTETLNVPFSSSVILLAASGVVSWSAYGNAKDLRGRPQARPARTRSSIVRPVEKPTPLVRA